MAKTVLVVDDERGIVTVVEAYLKNAGFRVVTASNGREALFAARYEKPDLILLDIMMPEVDGHEFIRLYNREGGSAPIILLTARVEEDDKVVGLELGADDYITKPFSPRELVARVRAVLRRGSAGQSEAAPQVIRVGKITLDQTSRTLAVGEERIDVTKSEFDLLAILMGAPGRAFTRLELLDYLRDSAFEGYERTIDIHIKNLRAKIEENSRRPRYIETVYGIGYRFSPE